MQSHFILPPTHGNFDETNHIKMAPVTGFARSFITGWPLVGAKITVLENDAVYYTDQEGKFGPIFWPVGSDITLVLEKEGFRTTQSGTVTVPPEGLTGAYDNISFQVPSNWAFKLFSYAIGIKEHPNACIVAATITAHNKTMDDIPQGEPGAKCIVDAVLKHKPHYFGFFDIPILKHKTNPLDRSLEETSIDGGFIVQVEATGQVHKVTAEKKDIRFTESKFIARECFINLSPPHGPRVHKLSNEQDDESPSLPQSHPRMR